MKETNISHFIKTIITDIFTIWYKELKRVFSDIGVIIFLIALPLGYPLVYSYIYNNEAVREVPIVVVDQNRSSISRDFIRRSDATPEIKVAKHCSDMNEAQNELRLHKAYSILLIPNDFSRNIARGKQSNISFYSDMSSMLFYKAVLGGVSDVSLAMGKEIQISNLSNQTSEQGKRISSPIKYQSISIYNPSIGFASSIIPAILIIIIQQALLLGIGMLVGTNHNRANHTFEIEYHNRHFIGTMREVIGKSICYLMIASLMSVWVLRVIPYLFHFPQIGNPFHILLFILPYLLACIFFAITFSAIVQDRETPILIFVFTSIPLMFLSGISWPLTAIPEGWRWFSYLFPSTFGVQGFIKINTMGATLWQVKSEYLTLIVQVLFYFTTACLTTHFIIKK